MPEFLVFIGGICWEAFTDPVEAARFADLAYRQGLPVRLRLVRP